MSELFTEEVSTYAPRYTWEESLNTFETYSTYKRLMGGQLFWDRGPLSRTCLGVTEPITAPPVAGLIVQHTELKWYPGTLMRLSVW